MTEQDRWLTARHEAAHVVINHALGVRVEQVYLDTNLPREGECVPEDVYEQYCGDDGAPSQHPLTDPAGYTWAVVVALRHAAAAVAGIVMEETFLGRTAEEAASEAETDLSKIAADIHFAINYIPVIGDPIIARPSIDNITAKLKAQVLAILRLEPARSAIESIALVLVNELKITDSQRIHSIVESAGLRFGAALPAFAIGVEVAPAQITK